ncbi:MAG: GxxExxY protein [Paludibacteraceae bacterium]|nr:GxxExxY protein [Paludibacteraceae bacterium]
MYKEETYKIRGAIYHVYSVLGDGFLEAVYQEALEIEFQKRGIPYEQEKELEIVYDGIVLQKKYVADFVCYGKIIVELKAITELEDSNRGQIRNYLKATNLQLGLLVNFRSPYGVEIERRLNYVDEE